MPTEVQAALIVSVSAVVVAWIQYGNRRLLRHTKQAAEKAVEQTEQTSNGFAAGMQEAVQDIQERLAAQDRRRDRQDLWTAQLLAKFDDRLIRIEESCQNIEPASSQRRQPTEKQ